MQFKYRYLTIDYMRFLAIFLMVYFHLYFDMNALGFIKINMRSAYWYYLPRLIVFLFLFCVGFSMALIHKNGIRWKHFSIRFFKISLGALLITFITYFQFPSQWVYFGTLHCIALVSLMSLPFVNRPKLSLAICFLILILRFGFGYRFEIGLFPDHYSFDYIPVFPWFNVVCLGIFFHHFGMKRVDHLFTKVPNIIDRFVSICSKHSLKIYLIHQPTIYGVLYLLKMAVQR